MDDLVLVDIDDSEPGRSGNIDEPTTYPKPGASGITHEAVTESETDPRPGTSGITSGSSSNIEVASSSVESGKYS